MGRKGINEGKVEVTRRRQGCKAGRGWNEMLQEWDQGRKSTGGQAGERSTLVLRDMVVSGPCREECQG